MGLIMKVIPTKLSELLIIEPDVHEDERGFFMETYHREKFRTLGIECDFVQDSHSHSKKNVIRGLKFQYDEPADKLVRVAQGSVFAVGVDIRPDSATFGKWEGVELSAENKRQLFLPFGFAFGFCVITDTADVLYKLSVVHNAEGSRTIRWNDPAIGILWPTDTPIVADADRTAPTLEECLLSPALQTFNIALANRSMH